MSILIRTASVVVILCMTLVAQAIPPTFQTPKNVSCNDWWAAIYWCPDTGDWYFIDDEWKNGNATIDYPLLHDGACGVWLYSLDNGGVGQYAESLWLTHSTLTGDVAPTLEDPTNVLYGDWWAAIYWCPSTGDWYFVDDEWKYGNAAIDYSLPHDRDCGVWLYFIDGGGIGRYSESVWLTHTTYYAPPGAIETVSVPAGSFTMGARDDGDDGTYAEDDEYPRHAVTLSAYEIGKYEVTNGEYSEFLNWVLGQGLLENSVGGAYSGGDAYVNDVMLLKVSDSYCQISYSGGVFSWKSRDGYSMELHPVVSVTWYGSVAFCNWRSAMDGLTPCYDISTWSLIVPYTNGYRLPTEAEWERAAAWDGSKHWIYGFVSDTLEGDRCNYRLEPGVFINPLGLSSLPYTSPVGWFDGVNVSPNGSISTVNSPSLVGAYDMTGNLWEWCHDRYDADYYDRGAMTNPTGPGSGSVRVLRGGGWYSYLKNCRSADRDRGNPADGYATAGFRAARTN